MEFSRVEGMQTFDQGLFKLFKEEKITAETAINYSDHKTDITMKIKAEGWDRKEYAVQLDIEEQKIESTVVDASSVWDEYTVLAEWGDGQTKVVEPYTYSGMLSKELANG